VAQCCGRETTHESRPSVPQCSILSQRRVIISYPSRSNLKVQTYRAQQQHSNPSSAQRIYPSSQQHKYPPHILRAPQFVFLTRNSRRRQISHQTPSITPTTKRKNPSVNPTPSKRMHAYHRNTNNPVPTPDLSRTRRGTAGTGVRMLIRTGDQCVIGRPTTKGQKPSVKPHTKSKRKDAHLVYKQYPHLAPPPRTRHSDSASPTTLRYHDRDSGVVWWGGANEKEGGVVGGGVGWGCVRKAECGPMPFRLKLAFIWRP